MERAAAEHDGCRAPSAVIVVAASLVMASVCAVHALILLLECVSICMSCFYEYVLTRP